ncbi:MAG: sortase [Anaerolineae bacterium]|nr:sortase [Anaerolineae bacterium]
MRDKRPVDELSIEELERILAIRKREARLARLRRYDGDGRRMAVPMVEEQPEPPTTNAGEPEAEAAPSPAVATPPADKPAKPRPAELPKAYYEDAPRFEDELDTRPRREGKPKSQAATWWNRLLLLVEVAAALGLIWLVVGLFQSLQVVNTTAETINREYQLTAAARVVIPTATPVINITAVVLPTGHTIKVNDKGIVEAASYNLDEVPAQYRDQYKALASQPQPVRTQVPEGPIRIQIPKIKVDSTVVSGDDWQALQLGVGHHIGSANPGERGNMVLSAHNDIYGEIFRELDKLKPNDTVIVSTATRDYTYVVREQRIVRPDEVWVLGPSNDQQVTLISCYPYRVDNKRIVVFATLQS